MNDTDDKIITLKDGRHLGYREYGDPQGIPLLFFHGWPSSRLHARSIDNVAKELNIRVISIDRAGMGLSTYKPNRVLLDWPNDVIELTDHLDIQRFSIIGVSGGGPYVATCVYKIPERIITAGIVVGLGPTYIPKLLEGMAILNQIFWGFIIRYTWLTKLFVYINYIQAKYLPTFTYFKYGFDKDQAILSQIKYEYANDSKQAFRSGLDGATLDAQLYAKSWGFDLKNITKKVHLWYGEQDRNVPIVIGKYYAQNIPSSQLITYPDEGHLIIRTHTKEILTAFLE